MRCTFNIIFSFVLTTVTILCIEASTKPIPDVKGVLFIFALSYFYTQFFSSKIFPKKKLF